MFLILENLGIFQLMLALNKIVNERGKLECSPSVPSSSPNIIINNSTKSQGGKIIL